MKYDEQQRDGFTFRLRIGQGFQEVERCTHPEMRLVDTVNAAGSKGVAMWCTTCGWKERRRSKDYEGVPRLPYDKTLHARYTAAYYKLANEGYQIALEARKAEQAEREAAARAEWDQWYAAYLASPEWQRIRGKVIARDPVCKGCGEHPTEQVHHLTYMRVGQELLLDLVGLCRQCHERIHEHGPRCRCRYCRPESMY